MVTILFTPPAQNCIKSSCIQNKKTTSSVPPVHRVHSPCLLQYKFILSPIYIHNRNKQCWANSTLLFWLKSIFCFLGLMEVSHDLVFCPLMVLPHTHTDPDILLKKLPLYFPLRMLLEKLLCSDATWQAEHHQWLLLHSETFSTVITAVRSLLLADDISLTLSGTDIL